MARELKIVLATRNPGKVRELRAVLGRMGVEAIGLEEIDPDRRIPEPPEDGDSFAENARAKAAYYARATGLLALADDSGLVVDALNGAPGTHSARYAAGECPPGAGRGRIDSANNARLLRQLAGVSDERRTARFVCHLALSDAGHVLIESDGLIEGRIGHEPRGRNGFGYDPLFFVPELGCTTAELPEDRKNDFSHRGQATRKFAAMLKELLRRQPS